YLKHNAIRLSISKALLIFHCKFKKPKG
ncbi:hypothetical protein X975_10584, partial [Stegodyphus mimosarum]